MIEPAGGHVVLDLAVPPVAVSGLRRALGLGRARPLCVTWHDDEAGTLARNGLALVAWREGRASLWRVLAMVPGGEHAVLTGAPPPVLAEAAELSGLDGIALPDRLVSRRRLDGRVRLGKAGALAVRLLDGETEDGTAVARLELRGPAREAEPFLLSLAAAQSVAVPPRNLSEELLAGSGLKLPPRRLGAPQLRGSLAPGDAFAEAASHLLAVVLHHAPAAAAGRFGEPVHQMRVALRRLRALASVFAPAVACAELEALRPELKALATALGPARDWDVFLAGTGQAAAEAFAQEEALAGLLAAAAERREAAYAALAALIDGPALRSMAIRVALLAQARPWQAAEAAQDTSAFGAAVLARRWRRVARGARDIATTPEAELHALRLKAKRLRYAAELFAPLYPGGGTARFLKRLAALQEALGHLNDGVVATGLMQALADAGGTGLAGGLVRGFVAGRAADARAEIARAWRRLRKVGPFWD